MSTSDYTVDHAVEKSDQYTQELRVADKIGPVDVLVGAYYFNESNFAGNSDPLNGAYFGLPAMENRGFENGGHQVTQAYALFTQNTIHLTDSLGVDLGVRYSSERKRMNQLFDFDLVTPYDPTAPLFTIKPSTRFLSQNAKWSSTDPRVTIHYQWTPAIYTYATFARGFKSGGFNFSSFQPAFSPEKITDYEVGVKADLLDRRLRVNVSAFKYDYTNLQVNIAEELALVTTNAGASKLKGAEMELSYLATRDLRLDLNFAYLDSKYTQYTTADPDRLQLGTLNLAGNQLSYAPKVKADAGAAYTFHESYGELTPRASVAWVDRTYFSQFNLPYVREGGHYTADLFLDYASSDANWSAVAFVKNATNHYYKISDAVAASFFGFPLLGQVAPPRTFGLSLTRRF
jgi:iron complex outermembrane receptor protein